MDTFPACTLRLRPRHAHITRTKDCSGHTKTAPTEIAEVFTDFFKTLYNHSPGDNNDNITYREAIHTYLTKLQLPKLSPTTQTVLGAEITADEIDQAITRLKRDIKPMDQTDMREATIKK
ncbi:Hypothetical predicted protein [Pelobates cultripes]|uniref:Uncharacterized protein n=1 Tax=Pelobates cultripes TaxID=61616 RepID=A0AAD1W3A5_PELCU|nr:Hypothetical predicted protein [Pelobates cultripes]